LGEAVADEPAQDRLEALAGFVAVAEAEELAKVPVGDAGRSGEGPQHREAPDEQGGGRAEHRCPALLYVLVVEREPLLLDLRVGMVDRTEGQDVTWFHDLLAHPPPDRA
jgi:hypothetical protein